MTHTKNVYMTQNICRGSFLYLSPYYNKPTCNRLWRLQGWKHCNPWESTPTGVLGIPRLAGSPILMISFSIGRSFRLQTST